MQISCHRVKHNKNNEIACGRLCIAGRGWYFWQTVGLFRIHFDPPAKSVDLHGQHVTFDRL
jgi:hypothetical protein